MANINFGFDTKKSFTIDGDENRVIYLDTADVGIVKRFNDSISQINELEKKWEKLTDMSTDNEGDYVDFTTLFAEVERDIRDIIDRIFDSPVSDTILGNSSAFSPVGGNYKFEQIINTLIGLYEADIKNEADKINKAHISKHTAKYTK